MFHGEGITVGVVAGLAPCPLTLFAMFPALSKGVPVAGLTFAAAMVLGVSLTLHGVATLTVVARDQSLAVLSRHGASVERASRPLDLAAGVLPTAIGLAAVAGR